MNKPSSTSSPRKATKPPVKKQPIRPVFIPKRVPSVWKRIPAFRGTTGMTWEDALEHTVLTDVEHVKEKEPDPEKHCMRRGAIRQSWLFKMIDNIEEEERKEQKRVKTKKNHTKIEPLSRICNVFKIQELGMISDGN